MDIAKDVRLKIPYTCWYSSKCGCQLRRLHFSPKQQGLKRQKHVDQDGDLQMQGTRIKRSKLMRKARRAAGRGEVEMQEAEVPLIPRTQ